MGEGKKRWTFLEPALCHLRISFWRVIKEDASGLSPPGSLCLSCVGAHVPISMSRTRLGVGDDGI